MLCPLCLLLSGTSAGLHPARRRGGPVPVRVRHNARVRVPRRGAVRALLHPHGATQQTHPQHPVASIASRRHRSVPLRVLSPLDERCHETWEPDGFTLSLRAPTHLQAHAYPIGSPCYPASSHIAPACPPSAPVTCALSNFMDMSLFENVFGGPLYGYTQLARTRAELPIPSLRLSGALSPASPAAARLPLSPLSISEAAAASACVGDPQVSTLRLKPQAMVLEETATSPNGGCAGLRRGPAHAAAAQRSPYPPRRHTLPPSKPPAAGESRCRRKMPLRAAPCCWPSARVLHPQSLIHSARHLFASALCSPLQRPVRCRVLVPPRAGHRRRERVDAGTLPPSHPSALPRPRPRLRPPLSVVQSRLAAL